MVNPSFTYSAEVPIHKKPGPLIFSRFVLSQYLYILRF